VLLQIESIKKRAEKPVHEKRLQHRKELKPEKRTTIGGKTAIADRGSSHSDPLGHRNHGSSPNATPPLRTGNGTEEKALPLSAIAQKQKS